MVYMSHNFCLELPWMKAINTFSNLFKRRSALMFPFVYCMCFVQPVCVNDTSCIIILLNWLICDLFLFVSKAYFLMLVVHLFVLLASLIFQFFQKHYWRIRSTKSHSDWYVLYTSVINSTVNLKQMNQRPFTSLRNSNCWAKLAQ